ncbi:hypothetical protein C8F01DRAFT_1237384 [Mycena amicta]|nr:hypothetical protein C8F01DRAFT_1237384 [Mycena amicta]
MAYHSNSTGPWSATGHPPPGPVSALHGPNALQGNALAALMWVAYDLGLTLDREVWSVWKTPWTITKFLYLFLRCNNLIALSFYFMETLGTTPFIMMLSLPPANSGIPNDGCERAKEVLMAGRGYIAATEVLALLVGEALILIRINALYGWARRWIILTVFLFLGEAIIAVVTTIITLLGGSNALSGSQNNLDCSSGASNLPDLNMATWCTSIAVTCIYLSMLLCKALELASENSLSLFQIFDSPDLFPTVHLCLRDACIYFLVVLAVVVMNLVLTVAQLGYAQIGTPWLIATYTVASTRIFLNLKDLTRRANAYNSATWSEFERASVLRFHSDLGA